MLLREVIQIDFFFFLLQMKGCVGGSSHPPLEGHLYRSIVFQIE
jgi:hypothetical protein